MEAQFSPTKMPESYSDLATTGRSTATIREESAGRWLASPATSSTTGAGGTIGRHRSRAVSNDDDLLARACGATGDQTEGSPQCR